MYTHVFNVLLELSPLRERLRTTISIARERPLLHVRGRMLLQIPICLEFVVTSLALESVHVFVLARMLELQNKVQNIYQLQTQRNLMSILREWQVLFYPHFRCIQKSTTEKGVNSTSFAGGSARLQITPHESFWQATFRKDARDERNMADGFVSHSTVHFLTCHVWMWGIHSGNSWSCALLLSQWNCSWAVLGVLFSSKTL